MKDFLSCTKAVMDKIAHIQFVITAQAVCINNTVRHDFLLDNR